MSKLEKLKISLKKIKPILSELESLKKQIKSAGEEVRSYYKYQNTDSDYTSETLIVDIANEYYIDDGVDELLELVEELEDMNLE